MECYKIYAKAKIKYISYVLEERAGVKLRAKALVLIIIVFATLTSVLAQAQLDNNIKDSSAFYVERSSFYLGEDVKIYFPNDSGLLQVVKPDGSTEEFVIKEGRDFHLTVEKTGNYKLSFFTTDKTYGASFTVVNMEKNNSAERSNVSTDANTSNKTCLLYTSPSPRD